MTCNLCKIFGKRLILFVCYTVAGTIMFYCIEKDYSRSFIEHHLSLQAKLQSKLQKQFNMSRNEVTNLFDEFKEAFRDNGLEWDYSNSHYFTVQLLTTIGYGNITPKTTLGRMLSLPYALIGIPIAGLLFQSIGKILSSHQKTVLSALERKVLNREGPIKHQAAKASLMTVITAFMFCLAGGGQYRYAHGPGTFSDGVYVWFMTLTTVGFGDLIAIEPLETKFSLKFIQPVPILLGLCVVSTAFSNISDCFKEGYFKNDLFGCVFCCCKCAAPKVDNSSSPSQNP